MLDNLVKMFYSVASYVPTVTGTTIAIAMYIVACDQICQNINCNCNCNYKDKDYACTSIHMYACNFNVHFSPPPNGCNNRLTVHVYSYYS